MVSTATRETLFARSVTSSREPTPTVELFNQALLKIYTTLSLHGSAKGPNTEDSSLVVGCFHSHVNLEENTVGAGEVTNVTNVTVLYS